MSERDDQGGHHWRKAARWAISTARAQMRRHQDQEFESPNVFTSWQRLSSEVRALDETAGELWRPPAAFFHRYVLEPILDRLKLERRQVAERAQPPGGPRAQPGWILDEPPCPVSWTSSEAPLLQADPFWRRFIVGPLLHRARREERRKLDQAQQHQTGETALSRVQQLRGQVGALLHRLSAATSFQGFRSIGHAVQRRVLEAAWLRTPETAAWARSAGVIEEFEYAAARAAVTQATWAQLQCFLLYAQEHSLPEPLQPVAPAPGPRHGAGSTRARSDGAGASRQPTAAPRNTCMSVRGLAC